MPFLRCHQSELNLDVVLLNGQSFRWRKAVLGGAERERPGRQCFFGAAKHRFWKLWREDEMNIGYEVMARFAKCCGDDENALRNYFQLDISLNSLYMQWKKADENFAKALTLSGSLLEGVRMVAQDPTESIFSFICSSNNNIKRISRMVERLCELYGESLTNIVLPDQKTVYDFADISRMAADEDMESKLRASGFGYRAAYLHQTAKKLAELGGESWVEELANKSYDEAKEGLQSLPGIGPKVADCICLTSLGKPAVVPVDTHVFQITAALYMPQLNEHKSLNKATYNQIGDIWRQKFGDYAGWAHTVLFSAQLRHFDAKSRIVKVKETKSKKRKVIRTEAIRRNSQNGCKATNEFTGKESKQLRQKKKSSNLEVKNLRKSSRLNRNGEAIVK